MEISEIIERGRKNHDNLLEGEKLDLDIHDGYENKIWSRVLAASNVLQMHRSVKNNRITKCVMSSNNFDKIKDSSFVVYKDDYHCSLNGIMIEKSDKVNDRYIGVYYESQSAKSMNDSDFYTFEVGAND